VAFDVIRRAAEVNGVTTGQNDFVELRNGNGASFEIDESRPEILQICRIGEYQ
jgi:hypothetical protein